MERKIGFNDKNRNNNDIVFGETKKSRNYMKHNNESIEKVSKGRESHPMRRCGPLCLTIGYRMAERLATLRD